MSLVREPYRRAIFFWLLICALMVIVMVAIGGITRLTHSGLSMASWKPVTGFIPPRSEAEWMAFFELYKQTPEYLKVNHGISLDEFKGIFWWEFIHRVWGRLIGLVVLIPFIYYLFKGALSPRMIGRVIWLLLLGGLQGVIGWVMVKSGMVDAPYVQPINLGSHLIAALLIFMFLVWYIHDLWQRPMSNQREGVGGRFGSLTVLITVMVFTGALVAGLKAGHIYNTWPKMGADWIAPSVGTMGSAAVDIVSNPATAQFVHRWLAIAVLLATLTCWRSVRDMVLTYQWRYNAVAVVVILQVLLGIATLLMSVPVWLGVTHQVTAFILVASVLSLWHGLTHPLNAIGKS